MNRIVTLLAATFSLFDISTATAEKADIGEHPNVLLILVDDLNDYQGTFVGHPQAITPNIDKLAASGTRFENAQSNIPVCQPSRNSLFTGVYPHHSLDYGWVPQHKQAVLKHNKTLQRMFSENGYVTLGTGKLMHAGQPKTWQQWGNPHKYDYGPMPFDGEKLTVTRNVPAPFRDIGPIDGGFGRLSDGFASPGMKGQPGWVLGRDLKPMRFLSDQDRDLTPDERHAHWAVKRLEEQAQNPDQPFFMGVGLVRPHTPMYAPDRFFDMYPIESLKLAPWLNGDEHDTHFAENSQPDAKGYRYFRELVASYQGDRERALKHFLQAYLACVTFMDEQVGTILDKLDSFPKLAANTVVVFTSDHGWQMGEKRYLFKNSPWEESTRIPLIIRVPGQPSRGKTVTQPVSLIDIFPTLVDYSNLEGDNRISEKGAGLGGASMRPLIEGKPNEWRGAKGALSVIGVFGAAANQWEIDKQSYSYRTERFRYIRYTNGKEELYDHAADPHEWNNLADHKQHSDIIEVLRAQVTSILYRE